MELLNATGMEAGYTLGMDPDGRERLVVAIKGTFRLCEAEGELDLADEQAPLVLADEFTGEPGFSAAVYESDYAPVKPRCDVLLNGSAHAPHGRAAGEVRVGLRVGSVEKSFNVVGDRVWDRGLTGLRPSPPEAFTRLPISYDRAFGGVDDTDPEKIDAFLPNPVGVGYHPRRPAKEVEGRPLPNTEELGRPVSTTVGSYQPMSFGPIGRGWPARVGFAGTYNQAWLDEVFPFLPSDFDARYFQAAPPDQQMDHPTGGEEVLLRNLTTSGETSFRLPSIEIPVEFSDAKYKRAQTDAVLDTVVIEPDRDRVLLTWRASHPLARNMLEMRQVVVGRMPRGWYRARQSAKAYYPSLRHLVAARRGEEPD